MSYSCPNHGNLYRSKEVLCDHEKVYERLEIKSIDKGSIGNLLHLNIVNPMMTKERLKQ
jgi:hypothetical protein